MNMSEDRFFNQVRSVMSDYRPEVPEAAYSGMRRKLWWSNFTRLSATRFNVWYAALLLASTTACIAWSLGSTDAEIKSSSASSVAPVQTQTENQAVLPSVQQAQIENSASAQPVATKSNVKQSTDSNPELTESANQTAQSNAVEVQVESTPETHVAAETQVTAPAEQKNTVQQGARKGLKVKTYGSSDSKK
jgi:hypothetical protein